MMVERRGESLRAGRKIRQAQGCYGSIRVTPNGQMADGSDTGGDFEAGYPALELCQGREAHHRRQSRELFHLCRNDKIHTADAQGDLAPRAVYRKVAHAATTSAVPPDVAEALPVEFVAVTATVMVEPISPDTGVYASVVAPEISEPSFFH